jgi:hypothetical protein
LTDDFYLYCLAFFSIMADDLLTALRGSFQNLRKVLDLISESATSSADLRANCGAPGRSYGSMVPRSCMENDWKTLLVPW